MPSALSRYDKIVSIVSGFTEFREDEREHLNCSEKGIKSVDNPKSIASDDLSEVPD
jgi:hypothetical protein